MISVLAQERLLGATLGSLLVGGIVLDQRRGIYRTLSDEKSAQLALHAPKGSVFGKDFASKFATTWNRAVDGTLGNLVAYLSSRRW